MKEKKKNLTEEELKQIQKEEEQELERISILMKANDIKEETFAFDIDGELVLKKEIADITLEAIDDPEEKYQLYYNVVNRLLIKYLPKGEQNKAARDFIYEEKNTFLTRGHRKGVDGIRGADGRMSYITEINELINIITNWISTKETTFDLYVKLRDLNKSKGY